MDTITERVARGAALLDAERPGWAHAIDAARLDMDSPCDCVLGQLWGRADNAWDGYWAALADPGLGIGTFGNAVDHGFAAEDKAGYLAADAEWLRVIAARAAVPEPAS